MKDNKATRTQLETLPFSKLLSRGACFLYGLVPLCMVSSCALNEAEQGVITKTKPQPVEINPAAIPKFEKKTEAPTEKKEKAETLTAPERKFSFRTPNMIEDLPSDKELDQKPRFKKSVDEKVGGATTIRATE